PGVDQVLELVRQRPRRQLEYRLLRSNVTIPRGRIWNERVVHLGDSAGFATDEIARVVLWEEISLVEKAADHAGASTRRQVVDLFREEDQDLAVLVDVGRFTEVRHVERPDQR